MNGVRTLLANNPPVYQSGGDQPVDIFQLNQDIWYREGPRQMGGAAPWRAFENPGAFISEAMPILMSAGFIILFVMIVWGALEVMLGANDPKSAESGKKRITSAIIGFLILFASYWIGQIIQIIFGINFGLQGQQ